MNYITMPLSLSSSPSSSLGSYTAYSYSSVYYICYCLGYLGLLVTGSNIRDTEISDTYS